jgi:hypothetical protein
MLGTSAAIVAAFGVLGAVAAFITLLHGIHLHELAGLSIGTGAGVAGEVLWVLAFAVAGLAFFSVGDRRLPRLRLALGAFALGLFGLASAHLVEGGINASHGALASFVASEFSLAAADLLFAAAAVIAAVALGRLLTDPMWGRARMNSTLSFAAFVFALGWAGRLVGEVLLVLAYNHYGIGGKVTTAYGVHGGAAAIGVIAGVIAGVGFLKAAQQQRTFGFSKSATRERLLGAAFTVLALGALAAVIAGIIFTSAPGLEGTAKTTTWLVAIEEVGIIGAAVFAAIGFFRMGNDRAAEEFPDPGGYGAPPAGVAGPMR